MQCTPFMALQTRVPFPGIGRSELVERMAFTQVRSLSDDQETVSYRQRLAFSWHADGSEIEHFELLA